MYTDKDLLMMAAARLYSMGVDLEALREKLRQMVAAGVPYTDPEMAETARQFQELDRQWKALEQDYLELRRDITGA